MIFGTVELWLLEQLVALSLPAWHCNGVFSGIVVQLGNQLAHSLFCIDGLALHYISSPDCQ